MKGGWGVRRGGEYLMRDARDTPHLAGKVLGDPVSELGRDQKSPDI